MKTTVKLGMGKAIVVEPRGDEIGVRVTLQVFGAVVHTEDMTPDAWGVFQSGGDLALEASAIAAARKAAAC